MLRSIHPTAKQAWAVSCTKKKDHVSRLLQSRRRRTLRYGGYVLKAKHSTDLTTHPDISLNLHSCNLYAHDDKVLATYKQHLRSSVRSFPAVYVIVREWYIRRLASPLASFYSNHEYIPLSKPSSSPNTFVAIIST